MSARQSTRTQHVQLCLGKAGALVGSLVYAQHGRREHCAVAYETAWLADTKQRFAISADLPLQPGHQSHKARSPLDSVFHGAIADTLPDAWGRRVIARDHAKRRRHDPSLPPLTELDYLLAVDDFSRVGALRIRDPDGHYLRTPETGESNTPLIVDLGRIFQASQSLERGQETAEDLRYLQGKGTSLGGVRPKCTIIDEHGHLAIGKFPSVSDERSVTRGEVLALSLAAKAGINAAQAHIVMLEGTPAAVIRRFDRDAAGGRIPYQSAASFLQASRTEDRSYAEIADVIRSHGESPTEDLQQLWRRLVFNLLITNVDDHLQNHGFLHGGHGLWRLSAAFDVNPFPDKTRESKTWLSETDGPITDLEMLIARREWFATNSEQARSIIAEVYGAVSTWRTVALSPAVGLTPGALDDFAPAFEHDALHAARTIAES